MLSKWTFAAAVAAMALGLGQSASAQALDQLESQLFEKAKPGSEKIYLGFVGDDVKDQEPAGVQVIEVVKGSPAELAGFRQGDIVFSFAGQRIKSSQELGATLVGLKPGDKVDVSLVRAQRQIETTMTLATRGDVVKKEIPAGTDPPSILLPEPSDLGQAEPIETLPSPDDRDLNLDVPDAAPAGGVVEPRRPVRNLIEGFLGGRGATDVDVEEVGEMVDGLLGGQGRVRVRVGQPVEGEAAADPTRPGVRVRVGNPDGVPVDGEGGVRVRVGNPGVPVPVADPVGPGVRVRVGNPEGVPVEGEGGVRVRVGNPEGGEVAPAKSPLAIEVQLLREEVFRLRARVDELEKRFGR